MPTNLLADARDEALLGRRRMMTPPLELDIAPMIDVTFLLLVFFLVTSVPDVQAALKLPPARHGVGVSPRLATTIALTARGAEPAAVFLGEIGQVEPLSPGGKQAAAIREYVLGGLRSGRETVLLKAERDVRHRDVARVVEAVQSIEGVQLHLAVQETD